MRRTTLDPQIRELARRLVAHEGASDSPAGRDLPAAFRASEKLRRPVSRLAGVAGFRMLLVRALTMAKAQTTCLGPLQVKPDGSPDGLSDPGNRTQSAEAGTGLIAELLGLLVAFVGEAFTVSLVADVWPDFPAFDREPWRKSDHDPTRQS